MEQGDAVERLLPIGAARQGAFAAKSGPPEACPAAPLAGTGSCCARNVLADWRTISEICKSCLASGLVLRQIMPIVRDGCGGLNRATETEAERVSTATAISGINVTPMPALTIWTSVDKELPSSNSRGSAEFMLQNDSA